MISSSVLSLVAGVGIFLMACQMMSSNLESASSAKLKFLFSKVSKSKLLGVGIGTAVTAVVQSSSASIVMVLGFVNAGVMSLLQATTIIFGANIGTTVTAQIVSLGLSGSGALSMTVVFSGFAGVGAVLNLFCKNDRWKKIGGILAGFGMLFVGLGLMSGSMGEFARMDAVKEFLAGIRNPLLLVAVGTVLTAVVQSCSVTTSVAVTMVAAGLVDLNQGIYLTIGANIGAVSPVVLASLASGKNAKRTALVHVLFNCVGAALFVGAGLVLSAGADMSLGDLFAALVPGAAKTRLAMFHTFFNVATTGLLLPVAGGLALMAQRAIPDSAAAEEDSSPKLHFLDANMLKTPPIAVQQTKREILNMGEIAMANLDIALDMVTTLDLSRKEEFARNEHELNFLNRTLVNFAVRLTELPGLSEKDRLYLATTIRGVSDLERVGDYAENITEYADMLVQSGASFSEEAQREIAGLRELVAELYGHVAAAYADEDRDELERVFAVEERIDDYTNQMEENHLKRLADGTCSPNAGAQYISLSSNVERIADHLTNVAKSIQKI
ncbi:MAG: Na/Pi cotransporter family protein [Fibrobacterales bacterium]|nr:Na/Pi cotransporter family protein [Fibrobacterales bacterium]